MKRPHATHPPEPLLIVTIGICAWIAILVIVTALAAAAARGDVVLAAAVAADRRETAPGIVLLDWSGPPILASAPTRSASGARTPASGTASLP